MYNDLFTIGKFTVHGYGLMIGIGVILCYIMAEFRARRKGLDHERIFMLTIFCLIFGAIGSKVLYILTNLKNIIADPSVLLNFSDGWVLYGGIIGGIFGGWLYCRIKKMNFLDYFDIAIPSVALAQGFGRIGCFLAGCCYGNETTSAFSVTFHNSDFAPNDVPLIPTQLMSSAFDFLLCLLLIFIAAKFVKRGLVCGTYMLVYSVGRFILEFFRGDMARGHIGVLSTSQFIAIFIFIAGLIVVFLSAKGKFGERNSEKVSKESVEANETDGI